MWKPCGQNSSLLFGMKAVGAPFPGGGGPEWRNTCLLSFFPKFLSAAGFAADGV